MCNVIIRRTIPFLIEYEHFFKRIKSTNEFKTTYVILSVTAYQCLLTKTTASSRRQVMRVGMVKLHCISWTCRIARRG